MGEGSFLYEKVVHREQRSTSNIKKFTEGGGVAIVDVQFTREKVEVSKGGMRLDNVIAGHGWRVSKGYDGV